MIDFDKAPEWADCVMSATTEESRMNTQYWEGVNKYQGVKHGAVFDNDPATKAITQNWVRIPIVRQLEND